MEATESVRRSADQPPRVGFLVIGRKRPGFDPDWAKQIETEDEIFEDKGVKIIVDRDSLPFLKGSKIDFTAHGLNRTFQFDNPNATDECGCGESFTISS